MGAFVSRFLGQASPTRAPPIDPTDEILPVHPFDSNPVLRECMLFWTFRFDDVLDADMLGHGLSQLLQMEGWRRLGGRFRRNADGKVEIHVPRVFSEARPALHFTKENFEIAIAEHPLASQLPKASGHVETFPSSRRFAPLALGPGTPRTFDDLLNLDVPQLALHVVTFTDGTLVSVNFNHATSDLGGLVAILNAWKLILAGRPQDVPKFRGYRTDPMAGLYESTPKEKSLVVDSFLSGWKMIYWALGHMWSSHWAPFEFRVVSIPRHVIDAFLERSRREALSEDDDTGNGSGTGFISENDVIVALCNRLMAQTMDRSRLIVTLVPIDPRGRAKTVFEADAAYVQNTPSAAFFQCSVAEAQDLALGKLAVRSRAAVTAQATEEQLKAAAVAVYASFKKTGNAPLAGTPTSALLCVTNWGKSGILEKTDFSPAIVKPSSRQRDGAKPGHPVWFHSDSLDPGSFATSIVGVMGRDLDRNLWLYGSFPTPTWDALIGFLEE